MRGLILSCAIAFGGFAVSSASAQTITLDDFETYNNDTATLKGVWSGAGAGSGEDIMMGTPGADGSAHFMRMVDRGFSFKRTAPDIANAPNKTVVPAGNYTLTFYFNNGMDGMNPMRDLDIKVIQNAENAVVSRFVGAAATTNGWVQHITPVFQLTDAPITLQLDAPSVGPEQDYVLGLDQFVLTPVASVPLLARAWPDQRIYLSRTETITITPSGGSGNYTQVLFDVGNDNSAEATDAAAPFEFTWDTLLNMPQDTSGTVALRVRLEDDASSHVETILNFTVDNMWNGRESLITNGDFSQWQGENSGVAGNLPVGWVDYQSINLVGTVTYGPGPGRNAGAGQALQIVSTGQTDPNRYVLRSNAITGNWKDLQTTYWGKGGFTRLYYQTSDDGGVTFVNSGQDAGLANDASWIFAVEGVPQNGLELDDDDQVALGTHHYGTATQLWDDITWEGILVPADSDVDDWNLF